MNVVSEEDSAAEKSKPETSASSPRASEASCKVKATTSQSDIEGNEDRGEDQDHSEHQPSCCEFDQGHEEKIEIEIENRFGVELEMQMQMEIEVTEYENVEEPFEPTAEDYLKRGQEIEALKLGQLNRTVEEYALGLRRHAEKFNYARRVAYNRLFWLLSPFGASLKVFGSWATGFILGDSDIDVAVDPLILQYFVGCYSSRDRVVAALHSIRGLVEQRRWVTVQHMLAQAQVPVLKFVIVVLFRAWTPHSLSRTRRTGTTTCRRAPRPVWSRST